MSEAPAIAPDHELLTRYGCGPIRFSGHGDALYERHLRFDDIVAVDKAGACERFEAALRLGDRPRLDDWLANASHLFDPATEKFETFPSDKRGASVRQMLGRPGETWGGESGNDRLVVIRDQ